ncbi:hypothetical protein [Longimicrobium sp.]|uniref:hypothetical protein n=1 Tax=Longimicrobium sp. TaxID=2029185 RepID=UPI002F95F4C3
MSAGLVSVVALSEAAARRYIPTPGELCVSITDEEREAALRPGWAEVLRLHFYDMGDEYVGRGYDADLFGERHARAIYDLILRHPEAHTVVVHCHAGLCRSPAVAWAVKETFGLRVSIGEAGAWGARNARVYRIMLETARRMLASRSMERAS